MDLRMRQIPIPPLRGPCCRSGSSGRLVPSFNAVLCVDHHTETAKSRSTRLSASSLLTGQKVAASRDACAPGFRRCGLLQRQHPSPIQRFQRPRGRIWVARNVMLPSYILFGFRVSRFCRGRETPLSCGVYSRGALAHGAPEVTGRLPVESARA